MLRILVVLNIDLNALEAALINQETNGILPELSTILQHQCTGATSFAPFALCLGGFCISRLEVQAHQIS